MRLSKAPKIARNSPCPCGSGIKYKKCCFLRQREQENKQREIKRMLENDQKQKSEREEEKKEIVQESVREA